MADGSHFLEKMKKKKDKNQLYYYFYLHTSRIRKYNIFKYENEEKKHKPYYRYSAILVCTCLLSVCSCFLFTECEITVTSLLLSNMNLFGCHYAKNMLYFIWSRKTHKFYFIELQPYLLYQQESSTFYTHNIWQILIKQYR